MISYWLNDDRIALIKEGVPPPQGAEIQLFVRRENSLISNHKGTFIVDKIIYELRSEGSDAEQNYQVHLIKLK